MSLLKLIPSLLDIIFFTYESSPGSIFRSSALSECHGPNVVSPKKKCLTGNWGSYSVISTHHFFKNLIKKPQTILITWKIPWTQIKHPYNILLLIYQGFLSKTLKIQQGEWTIFNSSLTRPPAHAHSDIYLQTCMWDDCIAFLIAPFVTTRLLRDEIYHCIKLPFDWMIKECLFLCAWLFNFRFCYSGGRAMDLNSHRFSC